MKPTLYISDLDGTLLRDDETVSPYTAKVINDLVAKGMLFSYATARSAVTAEKVTKGLTTNIPRIIYNGAFVVNGEKRIIKNVFTKQQAAYILEQLIQANIDPIVYSLIHDKEQFSYVIKNDPLRIHTRENGGGSKQEQEALPRTQFLQTRAGDPRERKVHSQTELLDGEVFYFTCIDQEEKLAPIYENCKDEYECVFSKDYYTKSTWLEIMPKQATKAQAILKLKEQLNIDRIVSFGDSINDCSMFQISDECYAVANADEKVKKLATGVIASNMEDGVAHWLKEHIAS